MDRQSALTLTIILFALFTILCYYGAQITIWSSIIFSLFVSLILLCIFYPPSQMTTDDPDFTLVLYGIIIIGGILLLAIYIAQHSLSDVRQ